MLVPVIVPIIAPALVAMLRAFPLSVTRYCGITFAPLLSDFAIMPTIVVGPIGRDYTASCANHQSYNCAIPCYAIRRHCRCAPLLGAQRRGCLQSFVCQWRYRHTPALNVKR